MQLVADRFAVDDDGRVMDLATDANVVLKIGTAGGTSEHLRWTLRCDMLRAVQHRLLAPLVDFGLTRETARFEAWQCAPIRSASVQKTQSIAARASQALRALGMTAHLDVTAVYRGAAGPVLLPSEGTGYPDGSREPTAVDLPIEDCGLRMISRSAVVSLGEMFQVGETRRPHVAVLWGPRGSGKRVVTNELARVARVNGFVPIAARLIDTRYATLVEGRTLFIIADTSAPGAWEALLHSAMRSPRPHVCLVLSERESRAIDGVRLQPVSAEALVAAVCPDVGDARQRRRIRHAAESARGLPGRFVHLLWRESDDAVSTLASYASRPSLRVAERVAVYGATEQLDQPCVPASGGGIWPAPGELATLRRRVDGAVQDIARGRHAPGMRQLRQAVGGLARRDSWNDAADGAMALASALLRRGRARDAQSVLEEARHYAARAGREPLVVDAATLNGEAWIDLARLDEAEAVLGAAVAGARELRDMDRIAKAALALARCLYWRGQYDESVIALGSIGDASVSPIELRRQLLAARIAVGQGDGARAMRLVTGALDSARAAQDVTSIAAACCCAALVRLAIGDMEAAERDVTDAVAAAHAAHDPLRMVRVQLLHTAIDWRCGRTTTATARIKRLARVARTVPPIVRLRWQLLSALVASSRKPGDLVSRHVAATGLGALSLYAGDSRRPESSDVGGESLVKEVVAIVRACQTAADEAVVLKDVCGRVRQQLHAATVAFVATSASRHAMLAFDGARVEPAVGQRAVTAGITISPHRLDDRIEAGVPVQYGGIAIGALCARWTPGSTYDVTRSGHVLEMAAAAAAPVVSAIVRRSEQGTLPTAIELLGVTAAMTELRRSVERAAVAPFAALIDGESGSGKELVARAVHRLGPRRDRAFCTLNCAALPDDLIEAELFGHARGAFTGAVAERTGVFEEAHGGTLFLDEIGELSPRAQAKVLRVIQEGELRRVGENTSRRVDIRIVAATNRDLQAEAEAGRFRLDLLYRLDVIRISVPPLRERGDDIPMLAEHFWREATRRLDSRAMLSATTVAALARYDWPGNVRELQNVIAALAVRSPRRGVVPPSALPPHVGGRPCGETWTLTDARRTFDERFIRAALVRTGGHRGRAASELGVTRQGLTKLMTRLGIS